MGLVPAEVGQFGWRNGGKWREAVKELRGAGDHPTVAGKVPTREEATEMIQQGGGTIQRGGFGDPDMQPGERFGHAPGGDSNHTYPHINYTTSSGVKATVKVQP